MSMYDGVIENAKNQLASEQNPPQARTEPAYHRLPSHYRQQVTSTVFEVAAFWAKQNNTRPAESDLTALAKSLMAVISVVEADQ